MFALETNFKNTVFGNVTSAGKGKNKLSKETNTMLEATNDKILWDGSSKNFSLFSPIAKKSTITRWIICLGLFVIASIIQLVLAFTEKQELRKKEKL